MFDKGIHLIQKWTRSPQAHTVAIASMFFKISPNVLIKQGEMFDNGIHRYDSEMDKVPHTVATASMFSKINPYVSEASKYSTNSPLQLSNNKVGLFNNLS